jgi:cellulose synthase (UDP-forming)
MPALHGRSIDASAAPSDRPPLRPARRGAQSLALAGLVAGAVYLVWRWGWTVVPGALWLSIPLAAAETYGIMMLALLAFSCWRSAARRPPAPLPGRSVAVLIPTLDEPHEVLCPTIIGALGMSHDGPLSVWVLDDGARDWVAEACERLGAIYISRPAPHSGAKAENLNHALERVDAEFLVTLDADHVPRPLLLQRTLGYFADPRVALVQGPQAFFNRGFQHPRRDDDPLRNEQSIFFDAICPGKDRHNSVFWCGCPAVIRRAALDSVDGVATGTVVEDVHTSLRLHAAGWRTVYHDEVLALGLAPEDVGAFMVQRARWARGTMQILRREPPLLKRGLTWRQRIEYTASALHFFDGVRRLVVMCVPAAALLTGALPVPADPRAYVAIFVPTFVLAPLASRALLAGRYRFFEGELYAIVRLEPYLRALAALPRGRGSGFRVTPKGRRTGPAHVVRALRLPIALGMVTMIALGYQATAQLTGLPGRMGLAHYTITVMWAAWNLGLVVWACLWSAGVRHRRRSHRFLVGENATYAAGDGEPPLLTARVQDLSQEGIGLVVPERRRRGDRVRVVLLVDDGPVTLTGTVTVVVPLGAAWHLGVALDPMTAAVRDVITAWCLQRPFGRDHEVVVTEVGSPAIPGVRSTVAEEALAGEFSVAPAGVAADSGPIRSADGPGRRE